MKRSARKVIFLGRERKLDTWNLYDPLTYTILCASAIVLSLIFNRILISHSSPIFSSAHAADVLRWSKQPKPTTGGVSFYVIFMCAFAFLALLPGELFSEGDTKPIGLILAATFGFMLGLIDDVFHLRVSLKFLGQFLCANVLYFAGFVIVLNDYSAMNYCFTILWVIAIMNSINLIDNMDGISTIISVSILVMCLMTMFHFNQGDGLYTILIIACIGALLGFLSYNWNPSEIIMGDTGSQFLGVVLSAFSILFLWQVHEKNLADFIQFKQFVLPLVAFILPITDTLTVFIRRMALGKSPFMGGKDHTTHHLAYFGMTDRQVALTFAAFSLMSMIILGITLEAFRAWDSIYTFLAFLYFLTLLGSVQYIYFRNGKKKEEGTDQKGGIVKSIDSAKKTAP